MAESEWSAGSHYTVGWWLYIFLLFPTFVFNVGTFLLITYSPRLHTSSNALLVRYLAVEDGAFAFCCLVQCICNLGHDSLYGDQMACQVQAAYLSFFSLSTGYTLCCIAYNSEQKIGFKPGLSERQVLYIHLVLWTVSAMIATLCVITEPVRLIPSGTYCLPALDKLPPLLLLLVLGSSVTLVFLNHRYYLMWTHITRHTAAVLSAWEQHRLAAQTRQVTIAKRLMLLILVYFACFAPEFGLSAYELATGQEAPAVAHIVTGTLVHLNSLLNPVLYVYCNSNMRAALWETFKRGSRHRISPLSMLSSSPGPEPAQHLVSTGNRVTLLVETSTEGGQMVPTSPVLSPSVTSHKVDRVTLPPVRTFKLRPTPTLSPSFSPTGGVQAAVDHPFQPEAVHEVINASGHEVQSPGGHSQSHSELEL